MTKYEIQIITSDCKNAGSDARFYVTLSGSSNSSGEHRIDNSSDNFERNHLDRFLIDSPADLGTLSSVRIRHDNSGDKPGWHGRYLIARKIGSSIPYLARIDRWLATSEADHKTEASFSLFPHQPSEQFDHAFDAALYAFKFSNSFAAPIPLLGQRWGFCGGMSAGALYRARLQQLAPADTNTPAQGSPLYNELMNRQIKTLGGRVVPRMLEFQTAPDHPSDFKPHTVGYHTKANWGTRLKPVLRRGRTIVVLILASATDSPAKNHQVLGTGYRYFGDTQDLILNVYDPNLQGMTQLYFNLQRSYLHGRYDDGSQIRGFFWNECSDDASA